MGRSKISVPRKHKVTRYLSPAAAHDFLVLTETSHKFGIVQRTIYLERLSVLSQIGNPQDAATSFALSVIGQQEWPVHEDQWGHAPNGLLEENEEVAVSSIVGDTHNNDISFMTTAGGLKNWFFRPGDPDYFPSVPHGHWENRDKPKLDAYLGWVYEGSKQTDRLKRKSIVALWNDENFRAVAGAAIEYYLTNYPHYRGWRVSNPRRLPRRR